jgi:hypothetical protein
MAKNRIPDPLTRRHLVERALPEAEARAIADAYLAEGRTTEAVDFLRLANAHDRLRELRADAVSSGDAFLLRCVAQALPPPPQREEWRELAAAAEAAGKLRYAAEARRQAERGEE